MSTTKDETTPGGASLRPNVTKYEEELNTLKLELSKTLLSSTVDYVRNTTQVLQAVTGLLLTSYITLFVGLARQEELAKAALPIPIYFLPILFLVFSLIISIIRALFYSGHQLTLADLRSTVNAYEATSRRRRRHLVLPSILTLLGIVAFGFIAYSELLV